MAEPIATVGEYVLTHVDDKFQRWHTTPKDKHKKGENFTEYRDQNGNVAQLNWDGTGAVDGDGGPKVPGDTSWQKDTSWGLNGQTDNFTVLPSPGAGNAFSQAGIRPGDFIKVTDPATGQSTYTVYGDNGPPDELGEVSASTARDLGMNANPANGGFSDLSAANRLQYEAYPGSAIRNPNGSFKKLSKEEVQRYGTWAEVDAKTKIAGKKLVSGSNSVYVGPQIKPAIMADPMSMHVGDCPVDHGSDSVSIQGAPATRIGDACSCGLKVVSGYCPVVVGGNTTTKGPGASGDDSPTTFGGMTANQLGAGLNAPKFNGWPK